MKVFELHFNPDEKENLSFNTFCYQPENIYERKMGGIFMIGEIRRLLPHNAKLLEKISATAKKEFYSKFQRTPEGALKESLKRINEMLAGEVSKENTDWLGNLDFAILSLKNFDLHFTKTGGTKIFLIRGPHIVDIGKKLDKEEIEPYPLKIFNNIVSGKLAENDIILAANEELFPAIKDMVGEIGSQSPLDEKGLRDFVKSKENELVDSVGAFILLQVTKSPSEAKRPKIIFQKEPEKFSISQRISPIFQNAIKTADSLKKIQNVATGIIKIKRTKPEETIPEETNDPPVKKEKTPPVKVDVKIYKDDPPSRQPLKLPSIKIPSLKLPDFRQLRTKIKWDEKLLPIIILLAILLLGFLIFS